jgi:hypothetical protein
MSEGVVLDPLAWAELRALDPDGSQGLIRRLGEAFERTLQRLEPELDVALAQLGNELDPLRRCAHTLKSACANLAALQLAAQWQAIEQQCKEGQREGVEAQVAQARLALKALQDTLRNRA